MMSKMIFKTSEIPEEMELDLNGKILKFTYRKLSESETKETEQEVRKIQKKNARDQKLLYRAEKKAKKGASLQDVLKDLKDEKLKEYATTAYELEKLSDDKIENGEEIIELSSKMDSLVKDLFKADSFVNTVLNKQFDGTNKKEIIAAVKSMTEKDKESFYKVLDAGVHEQRMGKSKE